MFLAMIFPSPVGTATNGAIKAGFTIAVVAVVCPVCCLCPPPPTPPRVTGCPSCEANNGTAECGGIAAGMAPTGGGLTWLDGMGMAPTGGDLGEEVNLPPRGELVADPPFLGDEELTISAIPLVTAAAFPPRAAIRAGVAVEELLFIIIMWDDRETFSSSGIPFLD